MSVNQPYRFDPRFRIPHPNLNAKKYRPGAVWVRKKDGVEFVLREKDGVGLRFKGYDGAFCEEMFTYKSG